MEEVWQYSVTLRNPPGGQRGDITEIRAFRHEPRLFTHWKIIYPYPYYYGNDCIALNLTTLIGQPNLVTATSSWQPLRVWPAHEWLTNGLKMLLLEKLKRKIFIMEFMIISVEIMRHVDHHSMLSCDPSPHHSERTDTHCTIYMYSVALCTIALHSTVNYICTALHCALLRCAHCTKYYLQHCSALCSWHSSSHHCALMNTRINSGQ